jgi:protein-S-isoprenylcysteine O-methyltransferase Ste14
MERFLADFPFLISLLAGALACCSAVALRRASVVVGAWASLLAGLMRAAGLAAFAFSFLWAWDLGASRLFSGVVSTFGSYPLPTVQPESNPPAVVLGAVLLAAGVGLAIWGLQTKGWGAALLVAPPRRETKLPYARLKRPIGLGLILAAFGITLLAQSLPLLVCLIAWLPLVLLLLELEEWEMQARFPAARDYLRRTARYLPRRRSPPGR